MEDRLGLSTEAGLAEYTLTGHTHVVACFLSYRLLPWALKDALPVLYWDTSHTSLSMPVLRLVGGVLLALPAIRVPVLRDVHHGPIMIQPSHPSRTRLVQERSMDPLSHMGEAGLLKHKLTLSRCGHKEHLPVWDGLGTVSSCFSGNPLLRTSLHFPRAYLFLSSVLATILVLSCKPIPLDSQAQRPFFESVPSSKCFVRLMGFIRLA